MAAVLLGLCAIFTYILPVFADKADTATTETVRSGAEIDYPPFSIVDEKVAFSGFSVALLRAAMGRMVTFRTGPWNEVRGWLEHDEIDVKELADLNGRRVAVMKGGNAEEFMRRERRDFDIRTTPLSK